MLVRLEKLIGCLGWSLAWWVVMVWIGFMGVSLLDKIGLVVGVGGVGVGVRVGRGVGVKYTITFTNEIELNPEHYPEGSTEDEMIAIDIGGMKYDYGLWIAMDGVMVDFKGEKVDG